MLQSSHAKAKRMLTAYLFVNHHGSISNSQNKHTFIHKLQFLQLRVRYIPPYSHYYSHSPPQLFSTFFGSASSKRRTSKYLRYFITFHSRANCQIPCATRVLLCKLRHPFLFPLAYHKIRLVRNVYEICILL